MSATISADGQYRHRLRREVAPLTGSGCLTWAMLNPSTADAVGDDPTIGRCIGFTQREGFAEMEVVNLFALRATDPRELREARDPVGPENNRHLAVALAEADRVVAAWGANAPGRRAAEVLKLAEQLNRGLWCLGENRDGTPRHPLYLAADTPLQPYTSPYRT